MDVVRGHRAMPAGARAAVAIGNFDGVHVGHQALLARARATAAARDLRAAVLTFEPHPAAVLAPGGGPPRLVSLARRLELLAAAGVELAVVEPFTRELAALTPEAFVDEVLLRALGARALVVGYDFSYGQGRRGSTAALTAHGARAGVSVDVVPAVEVDGEVASSTRIRECLRAGDLPRAERLLGRRWDIDGTVVHGAKRGRAIGIPTANIAPESEVIVAPGIYAVALRAGDRDLPAVASLGTSPTFVDGGGLVLEVHALDWDGDLYGQRVRTTFVARLRSEARYESAAALVAQIHRDIAAARVVLGAAGPRPGG
jgi:riboflavin kinase/FMN adenylyltransferase